jgi:hypothetical protein
MQAYPEYRVALPHQLRSAAIPPGNTLEALNGRVEADVCEFRLWQDKELDALLHRSPKFRYRCAHCGFCSPTFDSLQDFPEEIEKRLLFHARICERARKGVWLRAEDFIPFAR